MTAQPNEYLDEGTRFWTGDQDHSTPLIDRSDDMGGDVQSAFKEATYRRAASDDLEKALPHLEVLRDRHGSIRNGVDFYIQADQAYKANPAATDEYLKRHFKARGVYVPPEPKTRAAPPEYLDHKGRINWERDQDARDAVAAVPVNAALRKQIEDAEPLLTRVRRERGSIAAAADSVAGLEMAASLNAGAVDRVTEIYMGQRSPEASPVQNGHNLPALNEWLDRVVASGALPGLEHMESEVAVEIGRALANGAPVGGYEQLLVNAYSTVRAGIAGEIERAATAHERAEGERARLASRSLNAAPGGLDDNRPYTVDDDDDGKGSRSPHDDARRAYRSITGRGTRV